MAQYLKDDVRARIDKAALEVFGKVGVEPATMATIARRAGISTGNIYHYYPTKDALFEAVLPDSFVQRLEKLIRLRVAALDGIADARTLGPQAPFAVFARDLLAFSIEHRLKIVVLLGRAAGTRHAGFAAGLVETMLTMAVSHFRTLTPDLEVTRAQRVALDRIYRNWVVSIVEILETQKSESAIRDALEAFSRYHMAGLNGLFEVSGAR
jgi:AcrR family transcriptional regulator